MTERRGLSKWQWFQVALSVFLMPLMVRAAITGDKIALVVLVVVLMFCTYVLGYVIGFRSAKRSQSNTGRDPRIDAEGPVS
ncbi:hypothetical protein AB0D38_21260 [Streptomyces sp. NPDC048279]|uniref:hypothetical protein n=1 Tax=Streptomyces sp. NPDC048279 TaxID=3154714 RepID=UPI003439E5CA